ncbi:MAG: cytochrome-c oxidase, cbb3-type subunit III [Hyphomicrobiaceae bacterium]
MSQKEIDDVTGVETTGHEWDGVKELNKPLPRWWLWTFYATVVYAIVIWVLEPSWPTLSGYTKGVLGNSDRAEVQKRIAAAAAAQAGNLEKISNTELAQISKDQDLLQFAMGAAKTPFAENCAPCHGRGGQGGIGYPNLADDAWIWGGDIEAIHKTILHGIRWTHEDTRISDMPRYGIDELLQSNEINDVAEYVLSLGGGATDKEAAKRGQTTFAEQCATCHGEDGKGNRELGAPNLTDKTWLYGDDKNAILTSIRTGRGGKMPNWDDRLDPVILKSLAVYVHGLGGGE